MRAVFTVDLPRQQSPSEPGIAMDSGFIGANEIIRLVDRWSFTDITQIGESEINAMLRAQSSSLDVSSTGAHEHQITSPNTSLGSIENHGSTAIDINENYKRVAKRIFNEMPEVASSQRNQVIFTGYMSDDQTLLVITQPVIGQVKIRLLHRELALLQSSTVKMIESLRSNKAIEMSDPRITVYERHSDHVILTGRVIRSPIRETFRSDIKDTVLFIFPAILFLVISAVLVGYSAGDSATAKLIHDNLERGSTAFATTSLVSLLSLFTVFMSIRRHKVIEWQGIDPKRGR
ncbi:MAG: hypothetical protein QM589_14345 [Thermomicrobiales bacterium]